MQDISGFLNALSIPDNQEASADAPSETASDSVRLRGELVQRSQHEVSLSVGDIVYSIRIDDIVGARTDEAALSPDQARGPAVVLDVRPAATLGETRKVHASALGASVGLRPLVFAIASDASKLATSQQIDSSITVTHTSWITSANSPRLTGNTIDTTMDQFNDSQIDQSVDPDSADSTPASFSNQLNAGANGITVSGTNWITPKPTPKLTGTTIDTTMDQFNDSQIDQTIDP